MEFVLLDVLFTLKGFNENDAQGIYSNEVRDVKTDSFTVKQGSGLQVAQGLYSDIKANVQNLGASFHFSLYCCDLEGNLFNIKVKPYQDKENPSNDSKLNFFKFKSKNDVVDYTIIIDETINLKKGAVLYKAPAFKKGNKIKDDSMIEIAYDVLQDYLTYYFKGDSEVETVIESNQENQINTDLDDLPF